MCTMCFKFQIPESVQILNKSKNGQISKVLKSVTCSDLLQSSDNFEKFQVTC
jgi:hypothetical protein